MLRKLNQIARVGVHGSIVRLGWTLALLHKIHKIGKGSWFAYGVVAVASWIGIPSCVGTIGDLTVGYTAISQSRYDTAIPEE